MAMQRTLAFSFFIVLFTTALTSHGQPAPGTSAVQSSTVSSAPADLAQRQLDAYNARNIEAFLEPYAEDVELYDMPDKLLGKGKEAMRKQYGEMFAKAPGLHCELKNRIVVGNTVVDHERVTYRPDRPALEAVAIYTIENGKIKRVHFAR